jgi:hypothetical protein
VGWEEIRFNPLNAKLIPICHLLAMLGAYHILHVSRIRANIKDDGMYSYHRSLKTKP